ncbi:MAG: hypothetical protein NC417_10540 [Candidatus Gastranaerophilales bacterium]|nr:hypothetical protein [Candidatus Gastranaerophilales bacterium]
MLVSFLNSFLSYVMLLAVIVAACAVAGAIGINLRKRKNAKDGLTETAAGEQ